MGMHAVTKHAAGTFLYAYTHTHTRSKYVHMKASPLWWDFNEHNAFVIPPKYTAAEKLHFYDR